MVGAWAWIPSLVRWRNRIRSSSHPQLHGKFKASLGYMKHYLRPKQNRTRELNGCRFPLPSLYSDGGMVKRAERNKPVCGSLRPSHFLQAQTPLHKECCCPQWSGLPASIRVTKTTPPRQARRPSESRSSLIEPPFPGNSMLCHIGKYNEWRWHPFCKAFLERRKF